MREKANHLDRKIIRDMLDKGESVEAICEATGLSARCVQSFYDQRNPPKKKPRAKTPKGLETVMPENPPEAE